MNTGHISRTLPQDSLGRVLCKLGALILSFLFLELNPLWKYGYVSNLLSFLISDSGPNWGLILGEDFSDSQSLHWFLPQGLWTTFCPLWQCTNIACSILCLNLHLSLSQGLWSFSPYSPRDQKSLRAGAIFYLSLYPHHVAYSLAYKRWWEAIWWINKQMEQR